jgi:hypothetical protein
VQKDPDQATTITAQLAEWWNDVEEHSDIEGQSLSAYQVTLLTVLKNESKISLYRPILAAAHKGADYDASLQLCIASARAIISVLHKAIATKDMSGGTLEPLTLLWPSCTWAVWISTFILFFAANSKCLSQTALVRYMKFFPSAQAELIMTS